jgi:large subunit ribosomal protein L18
VRRFRSATEQVRKTVAGTPERPRLAVYRSLTHIYAQVIDDERGVTLAAASDLDKALKEAKGNKSERAKAVGSAIAEKAAVAGITQVVFDRGQQIPRPREGFGRGSARGADCVLGAARGRGDKQMVNQTGRVESRSGAPEGVYINRVSKVVKAAAASPSASSSATGRATSVRAWARRTRCRRRSARAPRSRART